MLLCAAAVCHQKNMHSALSNALCMFLSACDALSDEERACGQSACDALSDEASRAAVSSQGSPHIGEYTESFLL
jgi:hypothetical protein